MTKIWRKGDKVRNKLSGDIVEVYAFQPTHRTHGEGAGFKFKGHEKGFTFIISNDLVEDYEFWDEIEDYEFFERGELKGGLEDVEVLEMKNGTITKISRDGARFNKIPSKLVNTGDIVKTKEDYPGSPSDAFFEVIDGNRYVDVDGDKLFVEGWEGFDSIEVFRKAGELGKLKEGDVVKVKVPAEEVPVYKWGSVNSGDIGIVKDVGSDGFILVKFEAQEDWMGMEYEFDKVELNRAPARIGDKILIHNAYGEAYKNGDYLTVTKVNSDGDVLSTLEIEDVFIITDEFVIVGTEDVQTYKIGDYAEVAGKTYFNDIAVGTIVKIVDNLDEEGDYEIKLLDGSDFDYAGPGSLVKVKGKDAKFLDIGRIPGEFKDGDIVRITDNCGADPIEEGEIYEINADSYNSVRIEKDGIRWHVLAELISPVEKRFDRFE